MTDAPFTETHRKTLKMGNCGDEAWIADELWRWSSVRTSESRERFFRAVMSMIVIGRYKRRKERPQP